METPEFLILSGTQKADGFRLIRFLDQIILVDSAGEAVKRSFFPSRNAAKRVNRQFKKLRVAVQNPRNAPNCQNTMVPDLALIQPTKAQERLMSRIKDFELMKPTYEGQYTKPGAL